MADFAVVVSYDGSVLLLNAGASVTVSDLKASILEKGTFEVTEQEKLVLKYEGGPLADSSLLSSVVHDGVELQLELVSMLEVVLDRVGEENGIVLEMCRNETVAHLKARVFEQYQIPVSAQRIKQYGMGLGDAVNLASLRAEGSCLVQLQLTLRYTLTLEVFTGATVRLEVASDEAVDTLYAEVNRQARVPYHRQEIVYDGHVLEMGLKISDYHVPEGATLPVNLRNYEVMVFVKTLTGQTIMLRVTPRDTVAQVKAKIEQQEGIPIGKQRLIFVGEQLHDDHYFLDYRIEHESAVHLVIRERGVSFEVYVRAPSGRSHVFEVDPQASVEQIKSRLRDREGIPCDIQQFFYNGQRLQHDRPLTESGVVSGSTLRLSIDQNRSTQVFVSMQGHDTFPLWISQDYTILRVKQLIADKKEIAPELQRVFFARNLLDDERTIADYTIESNHMLHVDLVGPQLLQFTVTVQGAENGPLECQEPPYQIVRNIKNTLAQKLDAPVEQQQLFFGGSEMEDEQKLSDCGVGNGSDLHLILSSTGPNSTPGPSAGRETGQAVLFVKTLTGKTIMVDVSPTDSVLAVKQHIQAKEGVDVNHQCLVCGGKILDNNLTISECGVQNQSMLHLVLRVPSRSLVNIVIDCGGESKDLEVAESDLVRALKGKVEEVLGVRAEQQTLLIGDVVLDDAEPMSSYNITEGTIVQMQNN